MTEIPEHLMKRVQAACDRLKSGAEAFVDGAVSEAERQLEESGWLKNLAGDTHSGPSVVALSEADAQRWSDVAAVASELARLLEDSPVIALRYDHDIKQKLMDAGVDWTLDIPTLVEQLNFKIEELDNRLQAALTERDAAREQVANLHRDVKTNEESVDEDSLVYRSALIELDELGQELSNLPYSTEIGAKILSITTSVL